MTTENKYRQVATQVSARCGVYDSSYEAAACWPNERSLYECLLDAEDRWGDDVPDDPQLFEAHA